MTDKPKPLFEDSPVIGTNKIPVKVNPITFEVTKHNLFESPHFSTSTANQAQTISVSPGRVNGTQSTYGISQGTLSSHNASRLFVDSPINNINEIKKHEQELSQWCKEQKKPSKLDLDSLPPTPVKSQPGKPIFEDNEIENRCKPFIDAAINYVKEHFQPLIPSLPSIERQIRQLVPIKIDVVRTWGSSALDQESILATDVAKMIMSFSEIRGTELMQKILLLAKEVPSHGFFDKLLGNKKEKSALDYKPQLVVLKAELTQLFPQYEQYIKNTTASETRLMIQLASLVAVREVVGISNDDSLERTIIERRNILQLAATQAKLTKIQLLKSQESIASQLSKIEQLLMITLPAYELALAQQQK